MDYKKAYEEALERARTKRDEYKRLEGDKSYVPSDIEFIFPELKESEDERIRKAQLNYWRSVGGKEWYGVPVQEVIAWLENQGEQNITDKIEPKFKVGDTIEYFGERKELDNEPHTIKCINKDMYITTFGKKISFKYQDCYRIVKVAEKLEKDKWYVCTKTFVLRDKIVVLKGQTYKSNQNGAIEGENKCLFIDTHDGKSSDYFRPWTIEYAKDGDVLAASDGSIFLFAGVVDCACKYYVALTNDNYVKFNKEVGGGYWETSRAVRPATKEQCDLLFQKMKEAGYEWDTEKKELKKIEQSCYHNDGLYYAIDILEKTFGKVEGYQSDDGIIEHQKAIETVNALYHKKPTEWSEEDEKKIMWLVRLISTAGYRELETDKMPCHRIELIDWLKFIKERVKGE